MQTGPEIGLLDDDELEEPPLDELETPEEELLLNELDEELPFDDDELDEVPLLDELDEKLLLEELLEGKAPEDDELLEDDELDQELLELDEELLLKELDEELPKEELEDIAAILPSDRFQFASKTAAETVHNAAKSSGYDQCRCH